MIVFPASSETGIRSPSYCRHLRAPAPAAPAGAVHADRMRRGALRFRLRCYTSRGGSLSVLRPGRNPAAARAKHDQARRVLIEAMLAEAGRENWPQAVELAQRLEQAFGLPPELRRERARWQLARGELAAAGADLARILRELPGDAATAALIREWQQRTAGKDL